MIDVTTLTISELLNLSSSISKELRQRLVIRTSNGLSGDFGEWLFKEAIGWKLEENSRAGYDAISPELGRIQIKCRRITPRNPSRLLGSFRKLEKDPFDMLAAVLLDENYSIRRAALIPIDVVKNHASFNDHTNGHRFHLHDLIWTISSVRNVTEELRAVRTDAAPTAPN